MILEFSDERIRRHDTEVFNQHRAGYVIKAALVIMDITLPVALSISIVEPWRIQEVNRETRGRDEVTDVLSFPMLNMPLKRSDIDPDTGAAFIGDILINAERVKEQAAEYGNTLLREFSYMTVHGMLHLLGMDHEDDGEKRLMRAKEEAALKAVDAVICDVMSAKAAKAMEKAYAPYSGFAVGACVMSDSGAMYTGANVENASYGLTICAERSAVAKAVSAGVRRLEAVAVAARGSLPYPCGACRQVLHEFCDDMRVITVDAVNNITEEITLGALLPHAFGAKNL